MIIPPRVGFCSSKNCFIVFSSLFRCSNYVQRGKVGEGEFGDVGNVGDFGEFLVS